MDLRPIAGGLDPHPGFLTGLDLGQENKQSWQWQPPTPPPPQHLTKSRSSDVALPPWMMKPEAAEDEVSPTVNVDKPSAINLSDMQEAVVMEAAKGDLKQRPRTSPVIQILQSEGLDDMRKIIGKVRVEKQALRRRCSIAAFERLLRSGPDMDTILEFLGDRILNQRGARNLTFFVAHCLDASKVEEMRVLCKWMARQLYVGRYSDSALLTILQSLFKIRHQGGWQMVLDEFCKNAVEALRLSPVIHIEHLGPRAWSSFVGMLFHDCYSEEMVDIGFKFLQSSSAAQLDRLAELIWPIVEPWIQSWDPWRVARFSPATLTSKITTLLQLLPLPRLVETVTDISWRFLDLTSSKREFHLLWPKHWLWWSAVRSPEAFPYIRKTDSWLEIARALRRRHDEDIASLAVMDIQEHLEEGNLRAAHRSFLRSPRASLDQCPNLAEALILDSENNAKAALELFQTRNSTVFSEAQNTSESYPLKQLRQDRVDLLERMALAYARMPHSRPSFAFRCVYDCWSLHKRDKLGPTRPGMAHALIESGIVRPLQNGRRLVSKSRLEWILLQVAEAEGMEVTRKLGAAVRQWRDDVILQMEHRQNTERSGAIEQRWHEQRTLRYELDRWDSIQLAASIGTKASSKRQELWERRSVNHDKISPSAALEHHDRVQHGEEINAFRSFSEQASLSSPQDEGDAAYPDPGSGLYGSLEIGSSRSTTPEDTTVWKVPEQDHINEESFAPPPETSNNATEYLLHSSARKRNLNYPALRATQRPATIPADPSALLEPAQNPAAQITNRLGRVNTTGALLERLNSAALVCSQATIAAGSDPSADPQRELRPISPCSLGAAVAPDPRTVDSTTGEHGGMELVIRRVVGTGSVHGPRDAEEPSTLSTAMQPALGVGVATDLDTRARNAQDKSEGLGFQGE
ncbi:MAG: hypothetical protein Q9196_001429 [Gyalolechia fulgens]